VREEEWVRFEANRSVRRKSRMRERK